MLIFEFVFKESSYKIKGENGVNKRKKMRKWR